MGKQIEIKKMAKAGTVESNDILVMISPGEGDLDIDVESVVEKQYGKQIEKTVYDTLIEEEVDNAKVIVKDKGALDFTIKARVRAAVKRGSGDKDEL